MPPIGKLTYPRNIIGASRDVDGCGGSSAADKAGPSPIDVGIYGLLCWRIQPRSVGTHSSSLDQISAMFVAVITTSLLLKGGSPSTVRSPWLAFHSILLASVKGVACETTLNEDKSLVGQMLYAYT